MPDTAPTIGHNSTPAIDATVAKQVDAIVEAANFWRREVTALTTDEQASRCQDFIRQIDETAKKIDATRKTEKAPHLTAAAAVDAAYNPAIQRLNAAKTLLSPLRDGWLREIRRRQDDERVAAANRAEAARKAAEDAARKPVATVDDQLAREAAAAIAKEATAAADAAQKAKPQIHGELSGRAASLRTTWRAEITDLPKAVAHYLTTAPGRVALTEAVQVLANTDARLIKSEDLGIPGVVGKAMEKGV